MHNLDIIICTFVVLILFGSFIVVTFREFNNSEKSTNQAENKTTPPEN